jgi:hypothetical protein
MFRHTSLKNGFFYTVLANDTQYFIDFRADLTRVVFTEQATLLANISEAGGQHSCTINGSDNSSSITLQISDDSIISTGSYYNVGISYKDDNGIIFEQHIGNNDTITITELTPTSVRGTFYGKVSAIGSTITLSEGAFFVGRKR